MCVEKTVRDLYDICGIRREKSGRYATRRATYPPMGLTGWGSFGERAQADGSGQVARRARKAAAEGSDEIVLALDKEVMTD